MPRTNTDKNRAAIPGKTSNRKKIYLFLVLGAVCAVCCVMGRWLIPFAISLIFAYALHVPSSALARRIRISQSAASGIIVFLLVLLLTFFVFFLIPHLKNVMLILIQKLPKFLSVSQEAINGLISRASSAIGVDKVFDVTGSFQNYVGGLTSVWPNYLAGFINTGMALVYGAVFALMVPVITFNLLKDWGRLEAAVNATLVKFVSAAAIGAIRDVNAKLAAYVKGQLLICCILSCLYSSSLYFTGIEEYIVCGIFSGFLSFAPLFGPLVGLIVTLAMAIDDYTSVFQYVFACGLYVFIPILDSNFLTPKLIGKSTGTHPIWLLFAICMSASILGIAGIFLAVPLAVALSTICRGVFRRFGTSGKSAIL